MPRLAIALAPTLMLCLVVTACSSGGGSGAAGTAASAASGAAASSATASTTPTASTPASSATATGSEIAFTGKFSGTMTATACSGGMAQLRVDIDGESTTYAGIIDATDFTFTAPNSAGFTLAKGAAAPQVSDGGSTFTVNGTQLIGILDDNTVTATGSVTCP